ncbi:SGNH/GDSL hydrolase family protein [Neobacillus drentensis]|uniref:SGNH/GDSL hydrolase family protein n=1 Tax=Neobacillus drentensis TaxID=220684 RepID=UPI00285F14E4|nr:SGNH/GDSL hydrolase family protein [Neobacillus drentensis]MDR7238499.1 lysophospholipase L1-like esterase [Neobacillus drentensis]
MKIFRKFSSVVMIGALLTALPISTFAKGPAKKVIDYVALGDSLAYGTTPAGGVTRDLSYADYLVNRFEQSQYAVDFKNFGFPGYTSANLAQDVLTRADVQLKIKEAEFITIDIGANDLLPAVANPTKIPVALGTVAVNLQAILATIDQLNPTVKVYVMGYYNPFPYLAQEQQAELLPLLDTFNGIIEARTIANGDTFVETDTIIAKDYQTYLPNPANIHLSKEGYQLVAKEFWKNIDKSKN